MSSPELTFDEVVEARLPAVSVTMADPHDPAGHEVYREWRYEQGQVWLIHRDAQHTYSMRLAVPSGDPVERVAPRRPVRLPVLHRGPRGLRVRHRA